MSDQPTHIGNYRIERELYRDDQRIIYQGWQTALSKPVLITLLTSQKAKDTAFVTRWKQAAGDLRGHPHINNILDGAFSGEGIYLVERYLVADPLSQRLQEPWPLQESVKIWQELSDAIGYAHAKGWAAGMLTSDNVRILDNKTSYIMDFPWLAAQRDPKDPEAMKKDVESITAFFVAMRRTTSGELPELSGDADSDREMLTTWLKKGDEENARTEELAKALAPILLRALSGEFTTAQPLANDLKPLAIGRKTTGGSSRRTTDRTIMQPPPGATPSPYSARGTPPPPPATPQQSYYQQPPPPTAKSSKGWLWAGISVVVLVVALIGVLCWQGMLPFCVSCDEGLVREYVRAAETFSDRGAWTDAARELDSALNECSQCGNEVEACVQADEFKPRVQCQAQTEKHVTDAQTLINAGDVCTAVDELEQAIDLGCDTEIAEALLAGGKQGGAYFQCAQTLLEDPSPENCTQAYAYLSKAHELKPGNLTISSLYDQADAYAAFAKAFEKQQWDEAQKSLDALLLLVPEGAYCGESLPSYQFDILFGQGHDIEASEPCNAVAFYEDAEKAAETMAQKNQVKKALETSQKACADTWTPTPTPTMTPTPTPAPTPTPQPMAKVTKKSATVRKGPNTRHAKVATAKQGDEFEVLCKSKQSDGVWYHVQLPKEDGWIRGDMLSVDNSGYTATCTNVPKPPAVHYCWRSQIAGIDKLEVGRTELFVTVKDAYNRPKAGVRIQTINPYGGVTIGDHDTDGNGATAWAAVTPINWKICVYPNKACILAPYEEQDKSTGIRIHIEFKLNVCN